MDLWQADTYSNEAAFVYQEATPVVELLNAQHGERILDLGCGTGELAKILSDAGCRVTGVDASPSMAKLARAKNIDVRLMDAHKMNFRSEFDGVFSNYALHWMKKDPQKVIQNVKRSLKDDGKFVGELPASNCITTIFPAVKAVFQRRGLSFEERKPWFLPTVEQYKKMLESEGFNVDYISLRYRDVPIPKAPISWLKLFGQDLFRGIEENEKQQMYEEIKAEMSPFKMNDKGEFIADYVGIVFLAKKHPIAKSNCCFYCI
eukprot:g6070.t1